MKVGNTRKVLLRVSQAAIDRFGLKDAEFTSGKDAAASIVHEYWKNHYAEHFKSKGYSVQKEAPRRNGKVDLLVWNETETIGVEIETGKSDAVSNVRNCLLSRFDKVLVVATDEKAFARVGGQMKNAGFRFQKRVELVLQNGLTASE